VPALHKALASRDAEVVLTQLQASDLAQKAAQAVAARGRRRHLKEIVNCLVRDSTAATMAVGP
jgi:hypothetical protein